MIPLKDDTPRLTTPVMNYLLIAVNLLAFMYEVSLGSRAQTALIRLFGLVPARLAMFLQAAPPQAHVHHLHVLPSVTPAAALLPLLTSMFLHADWMHVLFNMWFLWIFGRNIEEALGHFPYLVFYLFCGLMAGVAQVFSEWGSPVPMVGASGAIAGVMGGYFVLYPRARVLMLVPFIFIFFLWMPAWVVLGYWFVLQLLSGLGAALLAANGYAGGVAFWAHVGGFVAGLILVRLFPARRMRYYYHS